jgi:hypothetical protein
VSKSALKSIASILYRGLLGYVVANVITGAYVGLIVVIGLMGSLTRCEPLRWSSY